MLRNSEGSDNAGRNSKLGLNLTIVMTGASGSVFAREMLCALEADERVERVHFLPSENSLRVLAEELEI